MKEEPSEPENQKTGKPENQIDENAPRAGGAKRSFRDRVRDANSKP
jgi:hypothetical protein